MHDAPNLVLDATGLRIGLVTSLYHEDVTNRLREGAVAAFVESGGDPENLYQVVAAGDSYNDLSMIRAANAGALFHAPQNVIDENSDLPAFDSYDKLRAWIDSPDPSLGT